MKSPATILNQPTIARNGTPPFPPPKGPRRTLPLWWKPVSLIALALIVGLVAGNVSSGAGGVRAELASLRGESNSSSSTLSQQLATAQAEGSSLQEQNSTLESQISSLTEQLRQANARRPLRQLTGMLRDDVVSLADKYGWQVTYKEKESTKPEGTVLSQTPATGTVMRFGAPITIVVAKPFPPKMPNLVGQTRNDAESVASSNGWKLTVQREVSSQPAGTIISQTPAAGTFMRGAAKFTVVLAKKAPAPVPVPTQQPPLNCDPNYSGQCLDPNASDYDCAGGSGNGPLYVYGTVRVVGIDIYGLDADNDGVGCE